MGLEKQGLKGGGGYVGGFFQLFDWNGKSRKKLSYDKFDLPEGMKQGKRSDVNMPTTRICLIEDDENIGVSSTKGSSDYSCTSSVTEEEGNGVRAPGVVARLMGLDSLPTPSVIEPYSTPLFQPQALRETHYQRKAPEYHEYQNTCSSSQPTRVEGFYRKTVESRPQKLPSSPIERFRTETLPPKSVKSHLITHHKLLSPIKSPGFIPPKNAADIIEAAAKILEPGYQASAKSRFPSVGSSLIATKVRDLKENMATSYRPSKLSETSRKPVESNAVKYLKGQSLNKSWNGPEDTPNFRVSPDSGDSHSVGSRNKGKSISLAIQAKVNVQRREGLSSSVKPLSIQKEDEEQKPNQPFKSQPSTPKNRQTKTSTSLASGVLRQNNQKQNCAATKEKLPPKQSVSNQQGRRVLYGESSFGQNKTFNKVSGSSKVGYKNGGLETIAIEKEVPSSRTKNLPRKKRAIDEDFHSEKSGFIDATVDRGEKLIQSRGVTNRHPNLAEDSKMKGMDVVSFTFTSPMVKHMPVSRSAGQMVEKWDTTNVCYVDSCGVKDAVDAKPKKLSFLGLNVIGGDALSILLEQKLRELTSGVESSGSNSVKSGMDATTSASILQDLVSALNTMSVTPRELDRRSLPGPQKDKSGDGSSCGFSSTNGEVLKMNRNLQGVKGIMDHGSSDARKELDCQHPSPVSILEVSFSNESCNSSESWDVTNGGKLYPSIQAQNLIGANCPKKAPLVEAEAELSDSASSTFRAAADCELSPRIGMGDHMRREKWEKGYVREILFNAKLTFPDLALGHACDIIDPCLFDRLESVKIGSRSEGEKGSKIRRELFDCVSECVDSKCSRYICGGYKAWAKGVAIVRKEGLAEEVYKDILDWRSMGDWMVDELVEKDMSSQLGRWLDFEAEGFEIGVEIESRILLSLLDEVVADLVV
ncbi:uncharacterized protein LOC131225201 [Magnolia sinica]|uniref:uncharacterized protein LOC131225201 n=1 Tax=Magnolia sinica TaxID=86752 RepID=UPI00265849F0|nr:uncharacterized protein LOC131225201 [Magnolia sinica]XP_058076664.1 uncharacterized protein LOC131225201 [Magnolia sinica]